MNRFALSQQSVRGKRGPHGTEKKGKIKEVIFDDAARREYLTGFHKRNLARKGVHAAKAKERQRQARLEFRREKRRELAERASANARAVERACGNNSDDEHLSVAGPLDEDEELEFEDEEQLATVTVIQDFDVSDTEGMKDRRPEGKYLEDESDNIGGPATIRRSTSQHIMPSRSTPAQKALPRGGPKKRVAYETRAARAVAKAKQRARHKEKKERGRSKSKSGLRSRSRHST